DYGAEHLVREINTSAARIIAEVADSEAQKDGRKRFVAGALGPTNKTLSLSPNVNDPGYREIDFDTLSDVYVEQIESLVEGGAEIVLIETVFDTLNAKAAIHAARRVDRELPIMLSMTITDLSGRNLSGHSIEAFWASVRHARPLSIGLNCSFGAGQLRAHVAALSAIADTLIMAYPNAGLPNDLGAYDEGPETTAAQVREWAEQGIVNIVGGCCGTTPAHIAAIARAVEGFAPRTLAKPTSRTLLAGIEPMILAA
ncbi:MAG: 5-methyltetrahydrofolate--homocysteine methyltransferase, partial [Alphaproteobacteria bacterium]